jgi:hypothetical protein
VSCELILVVVQQISCHNPCMFAENIDRIYKLLQKGKQESGDAGKSE